MKKTEKKQKPVPKRCVCGSEAITVKNRDKKMISCPNPMLCRANLITMWNKSEDLAINEWNGLVDSFYAQNRSKKG